MVSEIEQEALASPIAQSCRIELDVLTGKDRYTRLEVCDLLEKQRKVYTASATQQQFLYSREMSNQVHAQMDRTAEMQQVRRVNAWLTGISAALVYITVTVFTLWGAAGFPGHPWQR